MSTIWNPQLTFWEFIVWESIVSIDRFLDLVSHSLGSGSLQSGSLDSGSLQSRATDFGSRQPLTWDWESTVWESRVWESTGSVYQFWISPDSHLGLGVNSLGVYNVGVYNLGLPILDLASQLHVLKKKYRGSFS